MISSFLFERMPRIKTILYACRLRTPSSLKRKYFVYMPKGYRREEIDLVVNTTDVWKQKVKAMEQHHSQIHDLERIIKTSFGKPKREYFLVRQKGLPRTVRV